MPIRYSTRCWCGIDASEEWYSNTTSACPKWRSSAALVPRSTSLAIVTRPLAINSALLNSRAAPAQKVQTGVVNGTARLATDRDRSGWQRDATRTKSPGPPHRMLVAVPVWALADLEKLIRVPEGEHLEFKEATGGFHFERLAKYCAAAFQRGWRLDCPWRD
jgi:hypothetical protein